MKQIEFETYPIKKVHPVGNSKVITLDPHIVKKLGIDDWTFLSQQPVEGGILMKLMHLEECEK
jgi:hypothetical protein